MVANTPTQSDSLLHILELAARGIVRYVNTDKTMFLYFKQDGAISLNGKNLKLDDQFPYHVSNISSTENDVYIQIGKAWNVIDRLLTIWISDFSDKIK